MLKCRRRSASLFASPDRNCALNNRASRVKSLHMEGRFINDKENVPGVDEPIILILS